MWQYLARPKQGYLLPQELSWSLHPTDSSATCPGSHLRPATGKLLPLDCLSEYTTESFNTYNAFKAIEKPAEAQQKGKCSWLVSQQRKSFQFEAEKHSGLLC